MIGTQTNQKPKVFRISYFRITVIWLVLLLFFGALLGRLLYIQVIHPEFLVKEGNDRVVRNYVFEPARGLITDRHGKILAISMPVKSIYADVKLMHEDKRIQDPGFLADLASKLDVNPQELYKRLSDPTRRHVRLKQYLPLDKADALSSLKLKGLIIEDNYQRYYPTGEVNASVVGMLNSEGVGIMGAEQSFNAYLTPSEARRKAHKDSSGHIIENLNTQDGKAGGNLMLSIDDRLQAYAYSSLLANVKERNAESGTAVLMDVRTGEVLVMVSVPSFNPNDRSVFDSSKARNRAVTDIFEPGSTLKPFVALCGLEHGAVRWNEVFDTRPFKVDGKMVRDSHAMDTGTLADILRYSSNTGMAHISRRMKPEQIMQMLMNFGFGSATATGLRGEVNGRLNAYRSFWSEIDKATLGFGYGVAVTAVQLAGAYAALANYGQKVPVSILKSHMIPKAVQVANPIEIKRMHQVLETVVSQGTGSRAAISRYRIAGKTGTAKIAQAGGYGDHYISTFAGFAPISDPRFALVVVIRDPKEGSVYGGAVSGPVFRDVMTRALQLYNVAPDRN